MQLGLPVPEPGLPPLPRRELHALEFASSDSMTAFWSDGLKPRLPEKHHATVDKIAECMIDEYLIVTCGQLRKAWRSDVESAIVSQGGKATWVGAIEALLGCEFRDPAQVCLRLRPCLAPCTTTYPCTRRIATRSLAQRSSEPRPCIWRAHRSIL